MPSHHSPPLQEQYLSQVSSVLDPKSSRVRLSRELPHWLWTLLAYSLSIIPEAARSRSRLFVGMLLYSLTLLATLTFTATSGFFTVFDILSNKTHSTVFTGTADVVLGICWLFIGTYANHLAYRVLTTPTLSTNIRLHTRRFFRLNTGLLILVISSVGIGLHMFNFESNFHAEQCSLIGLNQLVCKMQYVSSCVYSVLALFWNIIVAWCVLSICRTHTIACRCFVRELEFEGKVLEKIYTLHVAQRASVMSPSRGSPHRVREMVRDSHSGERTAQLPSDFMQEVGTEDVLPPRPPSPDPIPVPVEVAQELLVVIRQSDTRHSSTERQPSSEPPPVGMDLPEMFRQLEAAGVTDPKEYENLLFTAEDLCMRYWRIGCQLRITSLVFQRWFATWLIFMAIWVLSYIVHWLNHVATFADLADFFLPVLLMGIICSAYAEVNLECARIIESVCPRPDRVSLNRFFISQPIFLYVYSMPMTYQVIAGLIAAFVIAFTSRIVMDEFDKSK